MTIPRLIKLVILVGVIALVAIVFLGFRARTEMGVTPARANQRIHQKFEIPPDSHDVDYYSTVIYSVADFSISRESFSAWANSQGWALREVTEEDVTLFRYAVEEPPEPTFIRSGMVFDAMDGDFGFKGAYDDVSGRATVSFSTH